MPTIWYVAWIMMCFQGDCVKFESAPYYKNVSHEFCQQMLHYTFVNQVGPYYDERIDFDNSVPEDIMIQSAGCDTTQRRPEDDDGKTWRIGPSDPVIIDPKQDSIINQIQKEHEAE